MPKLIMKKLLKALQKKMTIKCFFNVLPVLFAVFFIIFKFILNNNIYDAIYATIKILIVIFAIFFGIRQIIEYFSENKVGRGIVFMIVVSVVFFPLFEQSRDILLPVITERIDLTKWDIDSNKPHFVYSEKAKQYRIYFNHKIEDVDVFFTSYDKNGRHLARMNWVKGVDFYFKDDYIQTIHKLNKEYDPFEVLAKHTIIYKYRVPIGTYRKELGENQKRKEMFFNNFK